MSDYERQRQRHLARALTLAPALIDRLDWSADQLAVHRVERLRELVGYAIGSRWGRSLLGRPGRHLETRQRVLAKGEAAYARWGRLAVFFTPAIVSGTAKMAHGQFAVWNLIASFAFAVSVCASAYGLGRLLSGHTSPHDVGTLLVGLGVGFGLFWLAHVRRRRARAHQVA